MNHEKDPSASKKKHVFSFGKRREEKREAIWLGEGVELSEERELPAKGVVDVPFLLITLALVLFGCVMVYSASSVYAEQYHDDNTYFIARHLVFLLMAVAFTAVAVRFCTPRFWKDFSYILYGASIVLLLLVLVVGDDLGSGAKRWINLGFITLQPSEIAKIALVLSLARFTPEVE